MYAPLSPQLLPLCTGEWKQSVSNDLAALFTDCCTLPRFAPRTTPTTGQLPIAMAWKTRPTLSVFSKHPLTPSVYPCPHNHSKGAYVWGLPLRVRNDIVETITGYLNSKEIQIFNELNFKITESEVIDSLASLKRNKSPGIDGLVGEILMASCEFISKPLHSFFNSIFLSGHFPSNWQTSTLTPLHKKGYYLDPNNYRGIAVSSCLSKVFLTIQHKRLESFVEKHKLIPDTQIGYKKGARTTDHILCLKKYNRQVYFPETKKISVCLLCWF